MTSIYARKDRGAHRGALLYPHRHSDGTYVATNSKYAVDYVRVGSVEELVALVRSGYGARMSNPETGQAASFISHDSIIFSNNAEPGARFELGAELKSHLAQFADDDELDRNAATRKRKEQVFLRSYLLRGSYEGTCVLCGKTLPSELLVAAHIKPRAQCNRHEKLDFDAVAALMCSLGCDKLFESGYVYAPQGQIEKNPQRQTTPHLESAIRTLLRRKVANWTVSSAYYLWHAGEFGWEREGEQHDGTSSEVSGDS